MAHGLNPAQHEAVYTLAGPLLVLAGAGTGKTRVITFRIAELIKSGIRPQRILAVTFTNKAAREMRERTTALLPKRRRAPGEGPPEISTFHSLCVRVLRRHIPVLGYPREFTIYDGGDQESIARSALREIRVGAETMKPSELLSIISGWKQQSIRPANAEQHVNSDKLLLAARAYEKYQLALRARGAVDFDDLLLLAEELFSDHPEVRFSEQTRFDHLLIDEYQDTNGLQYRIVKTLAERHRNICVVGDDDQSIYGWRGAEVTHILNFKSDWPDAKMVKLEDNYRSKEPILRLANTLIAHNTVRHQKVLRAARSGGDEPRFIRYEDEQQEADAIVSEIKKKISTENEDRAHASDIAILFRTNEQPRAFEAAMRREKVPYTLVGGMSFYDRKEVKDVISYLRVLANPLDEVSLLRIINTPPRGIGPSAVTALLGDAVKVGKPLWELLPLAQTDGRLPTGTGERIERFRQLMETFRARLGKEPLGELMKSLVQTVDYKAELVRAYKEGSEIEARWAAVEEVINAAARYEERVTAEGEEATLLGFLEETSLSGKDDNDSKSKKKEEKQAVTLMTLHSAKGLEFPHVYLVGMEEGFMPHQRSIADGGNAIQEERRLAYVGVTRAQDTLTLSLTKQRMKWGKPKPSIPSRFLMEMRGETEKARKIAEVAAQELLRPDPPPFAEKRAAAAKAAAAKAAAKKPR